MGYKPSLKLGHGWVIVSHRIYVDKIAEDKTWIYDYISYFYVDMMSIPALYEV